MSTRQRWLNIGLSAAVAGLVGAGVASVGNPTQAQAAVRTALVQRGAVQATVSATGNVASPTSVNLGFTTGGRVTEIDVKPGDHVTAGQVLARVEDTQARANLASAQANLEAAEQRLAQVRHPLSDAQAAANAASERQAAAAVENARVALADVQRLVAANAIAYQNAVTAAENQLHTDQNQLQADQAQLQRDQQQQQQDQAAGNTAKANADAQAVAADQQKVDADNQAVAKDQTALQNAQTAQTQGLARDQQSVDAARAALTSAQHALGVTLANNALKAAPPLPGDLAAAQAAVASARAAFTSADQAAKGTVLTAPVDGTVGAVNGTVGQTVGGGGATSPASSTSGGAAGATSGGGSSASTGQPFMTLVDVSTLGVRAGFSETDAARVKVGQPATVTFPALPNEELAAHVAAVDATSTLVSNVVTYDVTLSLDNVSAQVKPGMSANVSVVVAKADNVLHVPTAAVRGGGALGRVTVMRNNTQTTVTVTVGVRGDDSVEIASGLSEGDQIVVSTGRATVGLPSGGPLRGVGGGVGRLGGGGFGGGARD